jgi:hypothetical protein
MSGRNAIDSLRRLSPVSDAEAAAVFGSAGPEELLAGVTRLPFGRRTSAPAGKRSRRPLVFALAALVVAGIATAATWAVLGSSARNTTSVECVIQGSDTIIPSISGDPAYDCALTWQNELGTAPPALVAYDNTQGGVTVLPRGTKPPAGWTVIRSQNVALIQLQYSLDDYINGLNSRSCVDAKDATALVEAKLAQFGFTGWTVKLRSPKSSSDACYYVDIVDPSSSTVTLIPTGQATGSAEAMFLRLAGKLRPLTQGCEPLPSAVAAVRAAANSMGLSESARTYELNSVSDDSLHCSSIYMTVGGTIFLTVRGPSG